MAPTPFMQIDESILTKGERRKLNALRTSVGNEVGNRASPSGFYLSSRQIARTTTRP